jgi:hypothetical protein
MLAAPSGLRQTRRRADPRGISHHGSRIHGARMARTAGPAKCHPRFPASASRFPARARPRRTGRICLRRMFGNHRDREGTVRYGDPYSKHGAQGEHTRRNADTESIRVRPSWGQRADRKDMGYAKTVHAGLYAGACAIQYDKSMRQRRNDHESPCSDVSRRVAGRPRRTSRG